MKTKIVAWLLVLAAALSLAACGAEEETTVTGMVTAVNGTVITLVEMDGDMSQMNFGSGEMPQMPEGMEGFDGTVPEGMENFQGFGGFGEGGFDGTMPEGMTTPEGMGDFSGFGGEGFDGTMPEGMTMPEEGQMPDFGDRGNMDFDPEDFASDMETKELDIGNAHISVEIDGGKASGSMQDIKAGVFVTITVNGKGEATYVLVSSQSFLGGRGTEN